MYSDGHLRMLQMMWLQYGRNWYVGVRTVVEMAAHGRVVARSAGRTLQEKKSSHDTDKGLQCLHHMASLTYISAKH